MRQINDNLRLELNRSDLKPEAAQKKLAAITHRDLGAHVTAELINNSAEIMFYDSDSYKGSLSVLKDGIAKLPPVE